MKLKHANYVLTILREGSFTAAAKKLYISQPSLSQTIKQVEANLGAPIFDRSSDELRLTYAGEKYVEAMQQVMMINTNLINEIEETKKEVHGRMRLGISVQRGMNLLPKVIPEFVKMYPHVKIELEEHGSHTLERLTMEGVCDIALVTTSPKNNNLEYVLIENEKLVLMVAGTTELAKQHLDGTEIDIAQAADEKFVSLRPGHSVRVLQDRLFSLYHMNPEILLETNSLEAAKHIAARSNAVMICPYVYIASSQALLSLTKCFPIRSNGYERHFYLCYRKGLYFAKYMEDFLSIVKSQLNTP